jgi:chemotaxis signal transduction protein
MRELGTDLVSVSVQSLSVALRASSIIEVLGRRPWVPVPGSRPELPGVVMWAGRAVALLDLPRLQPGLTPLEPEERRARLLIVASRGGHLAVPVDRISEVWRTHDDNLKPRHLIDFELCRSEVQNGDAVLPLFEPELLLGRLGLGAEA